MSIAPLAPPREEVHYPERDGNPIADNTLQFRWIVTIQGGLDRLFRNDPDVFVAGDLLWYPVEGQPSICAAPDALVVFGRPKGDRGAYIQHREGGIAPQVVFEVLSPGNRIPEMIRKHLFYQEHGVEEYYLYDPDGGELNGWQRQGAKLLEIPEMRGWVSPRLQVSFGLSRGDLVLTGPDGLPFLSYLELAEQAAAAENRAVEAQNRAAEAQNRAAEAQNRAAEAQGRAERLAARLRELGIDPEA